jgi:hypothetical protein
MLAIFQWVYWNAYKIYIFPTPNFYQYIILHVRVLCSNLCLKYILASMNVVIYCCKLKCICYYHFNGEEYRYNGIHIVYSTTCSVLKWTNISCFITLRSFNLLKVMRKNAIKLCHVIVSLKIHYKYFHTL